MYLVNEVTLTTCGNYKRSNGNERQKAGERDRSYAEFSGKWFSKIISWEFRGGWNMGKALKEVAIKSVCLGAGVLLVASIPFWGLVVPKQTRS